ncbi:MAG: TolC family protein [Victivallales bacterium]|nr:TolC family protein [Victivallales bacterium]
MYKNSGYYIICLMFVFVTVSCVRSNPSPEVVYSDNDTVEEGIYSRGKNINRRAAVNSTLENNPGYSASKDEADAARFRYYSSLSRFSPGAAVSGNSINKGYEVSMPEVMNALSEKAKSEEAGFAAENYRRKLSEDVKTNYNEFEKEKHIAGIQKQNETFQDQITVKSINNYKSSRASKADILNFKIKANLAKAEAVKAESSAEASSYDLASKMGVTTAQLPAGYSSLQNKAKSYEKPEITRNGLNYYLDLAIENRPDLKANKEALKSAKYDLYGSWGENLPTVNKTSGSGKPSLKASVNGSKFTEIRKQSAGLDMQKHKLMKKWISVVKQVKTCYVKFKAQLSVREKLLRAVIKAEDRRDLVLSQYIACKADITKLNQAQQTLVALRRRFIRTEAAVSKAKAKLSAACGIDLDGSSKKVGSEKTEQIQELNFNYKEFPIGESNAGADFNAAIGVQNY